MIYTAAVAANAAAETAVFSAAAQTEPQAVATAAQTEHCSAEVSSAAAQTDRQVQKTAATQVATMELSKVGTGVHVEIHDMHRVARRIPDEVEELVEELIETLELVAEEAARAPLAKASLEMVATQTSFDDGGPACSLPAVAAAAAAAAAATQTSFVQGVEEEVDSVHDLAATATQTSFMQLEELVCAAPAGAPIGAEAGAGGIAAKDEQHSQQAEDELVQDPVHVCGASLAQTQHPHDAAPTTQLEQQRIRRAQQAQQFLQFQQGLGGDSYMLQATPQLSRALTAVNLLKLQQHLEQEAQALAAADKFFADAVAAAGDTAPWVDPTPAPADSGCSGHGVGQQEESPEVAQDSMSMPAARHYHCDEQPEERAEPHPRDVRPHQQAAVWPNLVDTVTEEANGDGRGQSPLVTEFRALDLEEVERNDDICTGEYRENSPDGMRKEDTFCPPPSGASSRPLVGAVAERIQSTFKHIENAYDSSIGLSRSGARLSFPAGALGGRSELIGMQVVPVPPVVQVCFDVCLRVRVCVFACGCGCVCTCTCVSMCACARASAYL